MLYSLVLMTNMMVDDNEPLTASELLALETELTPLYVQANLNCGEWVEPLDVTTKPFLLDVVELRDMSELIQLDREQLSV